MLAGNTGVIVSIIVPQLREKSSQGPHYSPGSEKRPVFIISRESISLPSQALSSASTISVKKKNTKTAEIIGDDNKGLKSIN